MGGDLKIYLCNEVIRELSFPDQCVFASRSGYDGLEIAPFTLSSDPASLTSKDLAEYRRIAEGEGVEIAGLHWLLAVPDGLSITSTDRNRLGKTIGFGMRLTEICAELGGRYLVHGSPAQRVLSPGEEVRCRANAIAYFDAVGKAAADNGLTYIIEPLSRADTDFVNEPSEARTIIEALGHGSLATMIDCYAAARDCHDPARLIAREVPKGAIAHIHLNDDNKRAPGQGGTDFAAVISALLSLDYLCDAAIEPFDYHPDGPLCAARAIGYIRGLIDMCGTDEV